MNVLETTAECIWWLLNITANGIVAFLELNYTIVALVLHVIQTITNISAEVSSSFFEILKCYYYDFLTFSNELTLGVSFIVTMVVNFISRRVLQIYYFSCYVIDCINRIFTNTLTATNDTVYFLREMFNNILYFITVIFHAIVILLQLGPNLLIFFYETAIHCCKQSLELLQLALYSLWKNVYILPFECQKIICHVPLKAYFGLLILISLFHARNIIKKHLKNFSMFAFDQCIAFWFDILPKMIANIILFYKKWKRYLFPEETESGASSPTARSLRRKVLHVLRYFPHLLRFLKVPIYRVSEELSEHELQELQKKLYAEKERHICVVCHDRERSILLYPCRHICMCEECANTVQAAYQGCPLCRRNILDTLKVYT